MLPQQSGARELTPSERTIAVAMGLIMLSLSLLSLAVVVVLYLPFARLVEGLSK